MWAVEGLKFCTLMGSFCPNYAQFQLKSAEELSLMTLKGNGEFKEKLSCSFKHDIRSFADFHPTPQSLKISLRWALFTEELPFMTLISDAKFE